MKKNIQAFILMPLAFTVLMATETVEAGTGQMVPGSPSFLNLNLYYNYSPSDLSVMKNAFQEASRLLYNSTNGQLYIGTVRVSSNSAFQNKADVWVNSGASGAYTAVAGLGTSGAHTTLFENRHRWTAEDGPSGNERGQFGIDHEFGHYGFNLYDEYDTGGYSGACCVSTSSSTACIMDGGTTVHPEHHRTEWCTMAGGGLTTSHVTSPNTPQQVNHGHSCWQEIVNFCGSAYGIGFTAPAAVQTADPPGLPGIGWVTIGNRLRYVLTLDRSYSMSVDNKESLSKTAASLFVDLCKKDVGESIAVVSFSNTAVSDYPMHSVTTTPDTKTQAINAINAITLENMTALGDGLRCSLNEITGSGSVPPDESLIEAVVLLSDGVHNFGAETPASVLPDLIARGVRVYTIGLGDPAHPNYPLDETTLLDISAQTGALYSHAQNASQLNAIYTSYAADIRGMDSYPESSGELALEKSKEHAIPVDTFTKEEAFVLHWPFVKKAFSLKLEDPDGVSITPITPGVEYVEKDQYAFFRIQNPKPGMWKMFVTLRNVDQKGRRIRYTVQAMAKAPGLSCRVAPRQFFNKLNQPVLIRLFVSAGGIPVTKIDVSGTVTRPDGKSIKIQLVDNGDMKRGGDDKANDGIFSARFFDTGVTGSYQINLTVNCKKGMTAVPDEIDRNWKASRVEPFMRSAKSTFMVGKPTVKPPQTEIRK